MSTMLLLATAISCALTLVLLYKSVLILMAWLPGVTMAPRSHSDWLILGVVLNFVGSIGDNIWWSMAWYLRLVGDESYQFWFDYGVISNIVFRQGVKIASAHCHLRAAVAFRAMTYDQFRNVRYASFLLFSTSLIALVISLFVDWTIFFLNLRATVGEKLWDSWIPPQIPPGMILQVFQSLGLTATFL